MVEAVGMMWVRERVLCGELFGGAWLNLGSDVAAEIAGKAGFDWLLLDMEHGSGDYKDLFHQLQALAGSSSAGIVRVAEPRASELKRVLDMGPSGLMVPCVDSPEEAHELVRMVRIPPLGTRGAASSTRASGYGFGYEKYLAEANDGLLLVAQIESRLGVSNAEAIAAVEGIDVLFVGPTDLSIDLGIREQYQEASFQAALDTVVAGARRHGKAAGILARNHEQAAGYIARGFSFVSVGSDRGLISNGMRKNAEAFDRLRAEAGQGPRRKLAVVAGPDY